MFIYCNKCHDQNSIIIINLFYLLYDKFTLCGIFMRKLKNKKMNFYLYFISIGFFYFTLKYIGLFQCRHMKVFSVCFVFYCFL